MKSETLLLAAAVLVVGTGLVLFAGHDATPADPAGDAPGRGPSQPAAAEQASGAPDIVPAVAGAVAEWTIAVRDAEGDAVDGASVVARGPGGELRGSGPSCVFEDVPAGTWVVEIRAEGFFREEKRAPLKGAAAVETIVGLSTTKPMSVEVVDTRGEPVERERVWLLPAGTGHPDDPARRYEMTNALTSEVGRCRLPIVAGRPYRLSLGAAGEEPRAISEAFEAVPDMDGSARWTVLALARLTVVVDGLEDEETVLVTAWTDREPEDGPPASTPVGGPKDRDLIATTGSGEAAGTADSPGQDASTGDGGADSSEPAAAADPAARARVEAERARVAGLREEVGDELFRLRLEGGREATREGLPVGTRVRFRLQRGAETFAVPTSFNARPGDHARLRLVAREPFPVGAQMPEEPRTVPATVERLPSDAAASEPGLVTR